jgi:flagellar motor switch protein FliM
LNLAFPAVVANAILRRLTADFGRGSRHPSETRRLLEDRAKRIRFGTSLQLPTIRIPAKAIEELAPGALIRFDLPARVSPMWCAGGQVLTAAQAVRQGANRGARVEHAVLTAEGNDA